MFSKWILASSVLLLAATSIIADSTSAQDAADDNSDSQSVRSEKQPSGTLADDKASAPTAPVDRHLLDDLTRIRQQMGGSVLGGSALDDVDASRAFQANLQTLLSQPDPPIAPQRAQTFAGLPVSPAEDALFSTPQQGTFVAPPVVVTLRQQSEQIEQIANQLEKIRQYQHADALRASAKTLRELARSLDTSSPEVPNPRSSAEFQRY